MTDQEIFHELLPFLCEVTGVSADEVKMESVLMQDLGAESLDLLDLCFLIEERFGITIEPNEFENQAKSRIPTGVYDRDGLLTDEALAQLREALPEVDQTKLVPGLRKTGLPYLLTVAVFVHIIQRKLAQKEIASAHA